MLVKTEYGIVESAKLADLEPPMVDYLCRTGIVVPSMSPRRGRGRLRKFSFGDVVMLRAIAALLRAGVSVARLNRSLKSLRALHPEITPSALPSRYLVTDGTRVYFWNGEGSLESMDEGGQLSFGFVLELTRLRSEVLKLIEKLAA